MLGLTATPMRMDDEDNKRLWDVFDRELIIKIEKRALREQGILALPHVETVQTRVDMERDFTPEDYKYLARFGELAQSVLDRLAKHAARNKLIVDHYRNHAANYGKTIVFAATVPHARVLADEFQKAGFKADYVDYTRKDSADVMERFRDNSEQKHHFPQGVPAVSDQRFSPKPLRGLWGICRYSDRSIILSSVLNSPDIPLVVVEFVLYHELLHAAMPYSDHNPDFRERERRFTPSQEAINDAVQHEMTVPTGPGGWRALADQFLDTFPRRFSVPSHTDRMYY
ncbi:MAG: DUF45 domain-containing protein [Candidatus Omnitrophica bacterium]|nr:DUF45 domain-containing protein [Candidatus Omnitrophota bacterium]